MSALVGEDNSREVIQLISGKTIMQHHSRVVHGNFILYCQCLTQSSAPVCNVWQKYIITKGTYSKSMKITFLK